MPKIIGSTLAEHRAQTSERLLRAFAELIEERGLGNVAISDVAGRAGVGRTALYNHFAGKEELLLAYIMRQTEDYLAQIRDSLRAAGSHPVDQLRAYVRDMVLLDHPAQIGPDLRPMLSPQTLVRIREHVATVEAIPRAILAEGIDRGEFAQQDPEVVVPLINACVTTRRAPAGQHGKEQVIKETQAFVLRAVGAQCAEAGSAPAIGS